MTDEQEQYLALYAAAVDAMVIDGRPFYWNRNGDILCRQRELVQEAFGTENPIEVQPIDIDLVTAANFRDWTDEDLWDGYGKNSDHPDSWYWNLDKLANGSYDREKLPKHIAENMI